MRPQKTKRWPTRRKTKKSRRRANKEEKEEQKEEKTEKKERTARINHVVFVARVQLQINPANGEERPHGGEEEAKHDKNILLGDFGQIHVIYGLGGVDVTIPRIVFSIRLDGVRRKEGTQRRKIKERMREREQTTKEVVSHHDQQQHSKTDGCFIVTLTVTKSGAKEGRQIPSAEGLRPGFMASK